MLSLAVTLLIIALIAAVLGFGGIAVVSVQLAKIVFFVAIVLFLIAAVLGAIGGRRPVASPGRAKAKALDHLTTPKAAATELHAARRVS